MRATAPRSVPSKPRRPRSSCASVNTHCRSGTAGSTCSTRFVRHQRGIEACREHHRSEEWLTCEEAAALVHVDPKTLRRAAQRNEIPAIHPLPNGPWIFARCDVEGTDAARIAARARKYREGKCAELTPDQLPLRIPRT